MKLFLCGGGCGGQTLEATRRFAGATGLAKPVLYVPLAMEPEKYPGCREWIKGELGAVGITDIEMVTSAEELAAKELASYAGLFIGGGNTYTLLRRLKDSGAFESIRRFIDNGGAVFGGSAGAIIFGASIAACGSERARGSEDDFSGFDVLNGISLYCHYTERSDERLAELSRQMRIIALPEEDTVFVNGSYTGVIGTRPYRYFEDGAGRELQPGTWPLTGA